MLFYRFDQLLLEFAVKHNVWIVMTDEAFMDGTGYGKVIYLPQAHKMKRSGRGKPKPRRLEPIAGPDPNPHRVLTAGGIPRAMVPYYI